LTTVLKPYLSPTSGGDSLSRLRFSDEIVSRNLLYTYAFILLLLKATCYWIVSVYVYPQTPLDVVAIYRQMYDLDYYPQISALADFNFGESVLYEYAGTSIRSFPFASVLVHAICYKLLGSLGFILADIIITFSYFIALSTFFRLLRVSSLLAMSASLLIISRAVSFVLRQLCYRGGICVPLSFWYENIPKPFVTEIFVILFLIVVFSFALNHRLIVKKRLWVLLGIAFALLTQSDIYQMFTALIFSACTFLYLFLKLKEHRTRILQNLFILSCTAFLLTIPFLIQRLVEHADIPRRFGAFPVQRSIILIPPDFIINLLWLLLLCGVALLIYRFLLSKENPVEANLKRKVLLLMCGVCLASILSCTLSVLVLGKGIQLEHFTEVTHLLFGYATVLWLLYIADHGIKVVRQRFTESGKGSRILTVATKAGISLLVVMCAVYVVREANGWARYDRQVYDKFMSVDSKGWTTLFGYKDDFIGLVDELKGEEYAGAVVLGTFDHQVNDWWLTFQKGYTFLVDPFNSTVPDEVSESRLVAFCKLLGMSSDDFRSFINRRHINIWWYGQLKYQASRAYTYAPLGEYSEEVQEGIRKTTVYDNFEIALPKSEEVRLVNKFNTVVLEEKTLPRLDLIVLTKEESLRDFTPPAHLFGLSYENATFRVWKRKQALTQDLHKNYDFANSHRKERKRAK